MNALTLGIIAVVLFLLGYRFYAEKIANIFEVNPQNPLPSTTQYDGVDFVPAKNWFMLFGHHFASIAGAGPIIGPVLACIYWGWLPGIIWIVLGTIFIGGVHDFGSLMISLRNRANSVAQISQKIISHRARVVFLSFVWITLILIIGVFLYLCAQTFIKEPKIILPSLGLIPVALLVGFLLYFLRFNVFFSTLLGLGLLLMLIVLGAYFPIQQNFSIKVWLIVLVLYSYCASLLPVQVLLQPRDYLSSFLLFFGVSMGMLGLIFSRPTLQIQPFISWNTSLGNLWPMLFVTIACGAISGFHSLISSGTTSKQLSNERYAKRIGYGAMVLEGVLAMLALIAVAILLKPEQDYKFILNQEGPVNLFGRGFGLLLNPLLGKWGLFLAITMLNAFILTTLDTATRIARYLTEELFKIKKRFISTAIVVSLGAILAFSGKWQRIWPAFGASNQLIAALALLVISCWLFQKKKNFYVTFIPAVLMLLITISALLYQSFVYVKTKDLILLGISIILILLAFLVLEEAYKKIKYYV